MQVHKTTDVVENRYDFTILLETSYGNPNGDPDADGMPRMDAETGIGLVTDVCLKRHIRDYVKELKGQELGYDIYVTNDMSLNEKEKTAYEKLGINTDEIKKLKKDDPILGKKLSQAVCAMYYDVRAFGAVLTTIAKAKLNNSGVRGPVQIGIGQSIDSIYPMDITITRQAIARTEDLNDKGGTTMGHKYVVPYGLYRFNGSISSPDAMKTGFTYGDLDLLWQAILNMYDITQSTMSGHIAVRSLIVFEHDSKWGNAHKHELMDAISVKRKDGVEIPRRYEDYEVSIDETKVPSTVTIKKML